MLEQAHKRMQEWLEKQKKRTERLKKVHEYDKHMRNKTAEKFSHRQEFVLTANEYKTKWQRDNTRQVERNARQGMLDIKRRQIKSQETDRRSSLVHHESIVVSQSRQIESARKQLRLDNLNIDSALKSYREK